ncbi:MAG TPA: DUF4352 domain-containing protein [Coriobacteriia bacterium]
MLRRSAVLGMLVCCLALSAGCVFAQSKPDGSWSLSLLPLSFPTTTTARSTASGAGTSTTATSPASGGRGVGSAGGPFYVGKTLQSGPWRVVVESTESPKRLEDDSKPSASKKFLVVDVAIRNAGAGAALTVLPTQFALRNSANHVVDPFPTKLGSYNAQSVRPIGMALGGFTSFVYEVPSDTSVYTFAVTPKQGASGSMRWRVP